MGPAITTVAGNGTAGYSGDGGLAASAELNLIDTHGSVAVDAAGDLYITDGLNNRIREVNAETGIITTVAGNGTAGDTGDGGPATSAELDDPTGVTFGPNGNLYIAGSSAVRKVDMQTGIITTIASLGGAGPVVAIAVDSKSDVYVSAGGALLEETLSGGSYTQSTVPIYLPNVTGLAFGPNGDLYVGDIDTDDVVKLNTSTYAITTVAGGGSGTCSGATDSVGDGCSATSAILSNNIGGLTFDAAGNLYITDTFNDRIREVNAATGIITTVAGGNGYGGDGGPATDAELDWPTDVAVDTKGNIYISGRDNRIREVVQGSARLRWSFPTTALGSSSAPQNVLVELTAAQTITSATVPAAIGGKQEYTVNTAGITGCTVDGTTSNPAGSICSIPVTFTPGYPGERWAPLEITTNTGTWRVGLEGIGTGPQVAFTPGIITTVAGNGMMGYSGDGGPATSAEIGDPANVVIDGAGNLYIADYGNDRIREVNAATGVITTVAGNGTRGYSGDGGSATSAELNLGSTSGVAVDGAGNLYIADTGNNRIRKVDASTGIITTVAGGGTSSLGDGGPATSAEIGDPAGVAIDASGDLYITDSSNNRIRKVDTSTGIITTVAGNGTAGYSGDGGNATSAELNDPFNIAIDASGNLYIADFGNNRIREVSASTGVITTVAGNGTAGSIGDGGAATSAELNDPTGVAVDTAGDLYIADARNNRIREVSASTGVITTVAGNGTAGSIGDGGAATSAELNFPEGLTLSGAGDLYITGQSNNRIRKIAVSTPPGLSFAATVVGSTSSDSPQSVTIQNIGNQPMTFPPLTTGNNPTFAANFGYDSASTCPQLDPSSSASTLAAGATCTLGIDFTPTAGGSISGSAIITDTNLNAPAPNYTTQSIVLSGTGIQITLAPAAGALPAATVGAAYNETFTAGGGTSPYTYSATGLPSGLTLNSTTGALSGTPTATGDASITLTVTDANSINASQSYTLTVNAGTATVSAWPTASNITYGQPLSDSTLTSGTASVPGTFAWTTSTTIPTGAGSISESVTFTPTSSDYSTVTGTVDVAVAKSLVSVTVGSSLDPSVYSNNVTYTFDFIGASGMAVPTGSATITANGASLGTVTLNASGEATYSTGLLPAGSDTIKAVYGGDANYE